MDEKILYNLLKETELPVTYSHWPTKEESGKSPPPLPFITYLFNDSNNFAADNKAHQKINTYQVELYTDKKDIALEQKLEAIFDENDIFYDKLEAYIDEEKMREVLYLITI